jgi:hypothetical protein
VRGIFSTRGPHKKDDSAAPHAKALQPQFPVAFPSIFDRDHGRVKSGFKVRQIDAMPTQVLSSLRFIPGDHEATVYAE